ncbi:hypothetical protein D9M68_597420 [compost metagenome]
MFLPIFIAILLGFLSPSHSGYTNGCNGGTVYVSGTGDDSGDPDDPNDPNDPDDPNNPGDPGDDGTGGGAGQNPPPKP